MAASEYSIDLIVRRPVAARARFVAAQALIRAAVWLLGTTSIVTPRKLSPKVVSDKLSPKTKAYLEAKFKARYRGTVVDSAGSVLSSPTPASTPDSAQVALHRADDGIEELTLEQHLDERCEAEKFNVCERCGRTGLWLSTVGDERLCHGCTGYDPKLNPANCYDCGQPLGETVARGPYTHRPYHPHCIKLDRGTESAQVLG